MYISLDEVGQVMATFASVSAQAGKVCKMNGGRLVGSCAAGDAFCGVVHHLEDDGAAAVILRGYVTLPYTGTKPAVGYVKLAADSTGGVAASTTGREYLVLDVDEDYGTVGLYL